MAGIPSIRAREVALDVPHRPSDLCRRLRLDPTAEQCELMDSTAADYPVANVAGRAREAFMSLEGIDADTMRAVMMVALWRTLVVGGSRTTVLAPSVEGSTDCGLLGRLSMGFLSEVCLTRDPYLANVAILRGWNRVEFASTPGWEVRLIPNVVQMAADAGSRSTLGVILDAGNEQPVFVEAVRAFEGALKGPETRLIRLW